MTKEELENALLISSVTHAIGDEWRGLSSEQFFTDKEEWDEENEQPELSKADIELADQYMVRFYGAEISVEVETLDDGTRVITTRLKPLQTST